MRSDCSIPDHERVPELPEVQSLAENLDRRLTGRRVLKLLLASVSALKTYAPPPAALEGLAVSGVSRRGKFVDIAMGGGPGAEDTALHLVVHLSRAGWIHWRDAVAEKRLALRGPLAARLQMEDGAALDITEQGTEKRLAISIVRDPLEVPGLRRLGVDALDPALDLERLAGLLSSQTGHAEDGPRRPGGRRRGG